MPRPFEHDATESYMVIDGALLHPSDLNADRMGRTESDATRFALPILGRANHISECGSRILGRWGVCRPSPFLPVLQEIPEDPEDEGQGYRYDAGDSEGGEIRGEDDCAQHHRQEL